MGMWIRFRDFSAAVIAFVKVKRYIPIAIFNSCLPYACHLLTFFRVLYCKNFIPTETLSEFPTLALQF